MDAVSLQARAGIRLELDRAAFMARIRQSRERVSKPFASERISLAATVSGKILRSARLGTSPAVVHFAYWTRTAALKKLAEEFEINLPTGCQARPVGLVFHLPPQNVETVFLYSWMISYLSGNANVVRLPSQISEEMAAILDQFLQAFEDSGENSQLFVSYPAGSDLGVEICAESDARVLWGGDAKIEAFANVPLRRGGKSVWFGDRYSMGVLDGERVRGLDDAGRQELAAQIVNDIYVFQQMACSSPHVLYIVGDPERHEGALRKLFDAVAAAAAEKGFEPATGHAIQKLVEIFAAAGRGDADAVYRGGNLLTAARTDAARDTENRIGGGYVEYRYIKALGDLDPRLREHHQTLTYFGFEIGQMTEFASSRASPGLTRIVPMGQALDFDYVWDGYDLPRELTRLVRVL